MAKQTWREVERTETYGGARFEILSCGHILRKFESDRVNKTRICELCAPNPPASLIRLQEEWLDEMLERRLEAREAANKSKR